MENQSAHSADGIEDHSVPPDTIRTGTNIQFHSIIIEFNFFFNFVLHLYA